MRSERKFKMGVGMSSMLMIFVVLCLTTFAVLSYVTANADAKLTQKTEQQVSAYYQADSQAQQIIGELDGCLAFAREQAQLLTQTRDPQQISNAFSQQVQSKLRGLLQEEASGAALNRRLYEAMVLGIDTVEADDLVIASDENGGMTAAFAVPVTDSRQLQVVMEIPVTGETRYAISSYVLVNTQTGEEEEIGGNLAFG